MLAFFIALLLLNCFSYRYLRSLLSGKKGKRYPVVDSVYSLILQIGILYCLKCFISAFQLI
ncbi:hypothetical protein EJB10_04790 [Wolbachia endosymbiont of Brugia malayi]|nr:hypothetical protein EJB10_04790 [Wolbachia endosymbiont of Brugia malayi]